MWSLQTRPAKKFEELFPDVSPLGLDLLKKMLLFDPRKRITVDQALDHPYLEGLASENEQGEPAEPVEFADFEFEQHDLSTEQMKDMIYEEILLYHFPEERTRYQNDKKSCKSLIEHILTAETKDIVLSH